MILTSDSQLLPDFTPGLGGITLESLQQGRDFYVALPLCHSNGIRPVDISRFPEIHLPPRGDPPLDDVKVATTSSVPERSLSEHVGLVHFDPGIFQHLTNTGGVSIASITKGSVSISVLRIDIYVRMCQAGVMESRRIYCYHGKRSAIRCSHLHDPCSP